MKTKKMYLFLALVALIAAQLACAVGSGEPAIANIRVAKDEDGKQVAATFGDNETVYIVSDVSNAVVGNNVTARLYVDKVEGYDHGYFVNEVTIDITEEGSNLVSFYFEAPDGGWAIGAFYVEVYFNGTLASAVNFEIK